jgi:cell division protein YceG involved in septum cleavage
MKIQADATITYCTYCLLPPNGPFDDEFKYYYNTYRCKGLPAGPICNPGANALTPLRIRNKNRLSLLYHERRQVLLPENTG